MCNELCSRKFKIIWYWISNCKHLSSTRNFNRASSEMLTQLWPKMCSARAGEVGVPQPPRALSSPSWAAANSLPMFEGSFTQHTSSELYSQTGGPSKVLTYWFSFLFSSHPSEMIPILTATKMGHKNQIVAQFKTSKRTQQMAQGSYWYQVWNYCYPGSRS